MTPSAKPARTGRLPAIAWRNDRRGILHVYALDLRGHGRSDWPGTYTLALLRDDVLAFLDALKLPQVAGHLVHAAQPARFISAVTAFLAGPGDPAPGGPADPLA